MNAATEISVGHGVSPDLVKETPRQKPARHFIDEEDEPSFLQKYKMWIAVIAGSAMCGGVYMVASGSGKGHGGPPPKAPEQVVHPVSLPPAPLPPPPPPPPPEEQPKEEKMIEQEKMDEPEEKPQDTPQAPPENVSNIIGNGPNEFGLRSGKGGGTGNGNGAAQKKASRWGWYAAKVNQSLQGALTQNKKLRAAVFQGQAKIWLDSTGRVTKATIKSTGNADIDAALKDALTGLQLTEAPPADMVFPINLRLSAKRPN